ncbi:MAG: host-nuclease inhibitor Gam family protein [Desulfobacterales bacterium]|nr:host-nuclease inhibitor Gam family protein [Desulfobacterales bacterium]
MSKKKETNSLHDQADTTVYELARKRAQLGYLEAEMIDAMERVKAQYADKIRPLKEAIAGYEKDLVKFVKINKADLFDTRQESDRAVLPSGAVIRWAVLRRAKRVKDKASVIAALRANGWYDQAVKVVESVDWDTIDHWDDQALSAIGTERTEKEEIGVDTAGVKL